MSSRWQNAREETPGLGAWKRRLLEALAVAAVTYIGLRIWGSKDGSSDQVVVAAVTLPLSFGLLPVLEFGWHYLWTPWQQLKKDVETLQSSTKRHESSTKSVNVRVTLKNHARNGRELLKQSRHLGPYALQAQAASSWTDGVVQVLAKYCSSDAAEAFLDVADPEDSFQEQMKSRIDRLGEIAESAPTELKVPK